MAGKVVAARLTLHEHQMFLDIMAQHGSTSSATIRGLITKEYGHPSAFLAGYLAGWRAGFDQGIVGFDDLVLAVRQGLDAKMAEMEAMHLQSMGQVG